MFKAWFLDKTEGFTARLATLDESQLPPGDVLVDVSHSSLNFKDGLALTNRSPVVRTWPMVPGIDGSGRVLASTHPDTSAQGPRNPKKKMILLGVTFKKIQSLETSLGPT